MKKSALLFVMIFGFCVVGIQSQTSNRIALVIGNADYLEGIKKLNNSANDAVDMTKKLRDLGFQVIQVINGRYRDIEEKIRLFAQESKRATVRFFYYAGHGVQFDGENYLLPIDTGQIAAEYELRDKAVRAARVQDALADAGEGVNILVMDSCRDNPFRASSRSAGGGTRGLTVMGNIKGSLIAYATDPGKTAADGEGRNGVFTKALLERLDQPGKSLQEIMVEVTSDVQRATGNQQTPWVNASLSSMFYFDTPDEAKMKFTAKLSERESELKGIEAELEQLKAKLSGESDLAKKQNLDVELQRQVALKGQKEQERDSLLSEKKRQETAELARARELAEQVKFKEQQSAREEAIRAAAEKRKKELESIRSGSGTVLSLISTISSTRDARLEIEKEYGESLQKVVLQISGSYEAKIDECMRASKFPWENDAEFRDRINTERNRLESERSTQITAITKESEAKRIAAVRPFWEAESNTMENLQSQNVVYKGASVKLTFGEFDSDAKKFPITVTSTLPELPYTATLYYSILSSTQNELRDKYLEFDGYMKNNALYGEIESSIVSSGHRFVIVVDAVTIKAILPSGDKKLVENRTSVPAGVFSSGLDRDKTEAVTNALLVSAPGADVRIDGALVGRNRCCQVNPTAGVHVLTASLVSVNREWRSSVSVKPGLSRLVVPTSAPALVSLKNARDYRLGELNLSFNSSKEKVIAVESGSKDLVFKVPSGKDDDFSLYSPYADRIAEVKLSRMLKEDQRLQLTVPVGNFTLPWLPLDSRVLLVGDSRIDAGMSGKDGGYVSRPLPEGAYNVWIEGPRPFRGRVEIKADSAVELAGYRETMISGLEKEYEDLSQLNKKRVFFDIVGYLSLGAAAASVYLMADNYFKGKDTMETYKNAATTAAASAARADAEKYNTSFLIWSGVGGGTLLFAPFVFGAGPKGPETRMRLNSVVNDLRLLGSKK